MTIFTYTEALLMSGEQESLTEDEVQQLVIPAYGNFNAIRYGEAKPGEVGELMDYLAIGYGTAYRAFKATVEHSQELIHKRAETVQEGIEKLAVLAARGRRMKHRYVANGNELKAIQAGIVATEEVLRATPRGLIALGLADVGQMLDKIDQQHVGVKPKTKTKRKKRVRSK